VWRDRLCLWGRQFIRGGEHGDQQQDECHSQAAGQVVAALWAPAHLRGGDHNEPTMREGGGDASQEENYDRSLQNLQNLHVYRIYVSAEPTSLQNLRVYRTCSFQILPCFRPKLTKVLKIMFQQSLRGQDKTCKEMREVSQQSLRGHSLTCKEMRIFPTELEGSKPDLQRDEEVFQLESVEGC